MAIEHAIDQIVVLTVAVLETLGLVLLVAYAWHRYRLATLLHNTQRTQRAGTGLVVWSVLLIISLVGLVVFHL
jgi:LytS/YehU family sensor histidine kinase